MIDISKLKVELTEPRYVGKSAAEALAILIGPIPPPKVVTTIAETRGLDGVSLADVQEALKPVPQIPPDEKAFTDAVTLLAELKAQATLGILAPDDQSIVDAQAGVAAAFKPEFASIVLLLRGLF